MERPQEFPPVKLAFILDDQVVDVIHTDERMAAIFLSQPLVLDVTPAEGEELNVHVGDGYDNGTFIHSNQ
jgi:hypothetical protein